MRLHRGCWRDPFASERASPMRSALAACKPTRELACSSYELCVCVFVSRKFSNSPTLPQTSPYFPILPHPQTSPYFPIVFPHPFVSPFMHRRDGSWRFARPKTWGSWDGEEWGSLGKFPKLPQTSPFFPILPQTVFVRTELNRTGFFIVSKKLLQNHFESEFVRAKQLFQIQTCVSRSKSCFFQIQSDFEY